MKKREVACFVHKRGMPLKTPRFAKVFWSASLSRNFGYVGMGLHFGFLRQKKKLRKKTKNAVPLVHLKVFHNVGLNEYRLKPRKKSLRAFYESFGTSFWNCESKTRAKRRRSRTRKRRCPRLVLHTHTPNIHAPTTLNTHTHKKKTKTTRLISQPMMIYLRYRCVVESSPSRDDDVAETEKRDIQNRDTFIYRLRRASDTREWSLTRCLGMPETTRVSMIAISYVQT